MSNTSKFLHLGRSILFQSNRVRSNSHAVSSLLFSRGFNSLLRNDPTNALVGFHKNGYKNLLPNCFGGLRSYGGGEEMKEGDWNCPECNFHNFARNIRCLKCKANGPARQVNASNPEFRVGDWHCPRCQYVNFSRNQKCRSCHEPRVLERQMNFEETGNAQCE